MISSPSKTVKADSPEPAAAEQPVRQETATKTVRRRAPLLEDIVDAIRADARQNSLQYAIRSNVGHDGE